MPQSGEVSPFYIVTERMAFMKKLSLAMAAIVGLLCIAGCAQDIGKGKAPPPEVITKG
jgi:hypothetical protein